MESPFLLRIRETLDGERRISETTRSDFQALDHLVANIAQDLQVDYDGPEVGIGTNSGLHRLRVAEHHWTGAQRGWGVAVCSYAQSNHPRSEWRLAKVSRERLPLVLHALPRFFLGYVQVARSQREDRASLRRLQHIAKLLQR